MVSEEWGLVAGNFQCTRCEEAMMSIQALQPTCHAMTASYSSSLPPREPAAELGGSASNAGFFSILPPAAPGNELALFSLPLVQSLQTPAAFVRQDRAHHRSKLRHWGKSGCESRRDESP